MKYLDCFTGIGGFTKPLIEAGHTCVGFSEIDKYAISVYQRQYPDHDYLGDITKIDEKKLPDFDLLVGGFPCQSFSIAGKRGGFEDTRGTLFFDLARILKEKRPKYYIFENVKGLLSHDGGNTLGTIINSLWELGYTADYQVLNSKHFGVPQNRERIFIIGTREEDCGTLKEFWHFDYPKPPKTYCKLADILEDEVDEKYYLKDESVEKLIEYNIRNSINGNGFQAKFHNENENMSALKVGGGGVNDLIQVGSLGGDWEKRQNGRRFKEDGEPSFTLTAQDRHGVMISEATKKGFAVAEEGDSINLSVPNSKTRRGRVGKEVAQTLDTGMQQYTLQNTRIRRLTTIECLRLQGFPDDWCDYGVNDEVISDSQKYKMAGNAVTTNVIKAIIKQL